MHPLEIKILQVLGKSSNEVSTTILVREIFREEYDFLEEELNLKKDKKIINDNKKLLEAKRKKAQLHRKLLYHLNKLTDDGFIYVVKVEGKGEKYFSLSDVKTSHKKINPNVKNVFEGIERNYQNMLSGLETYEEKDIISIYDKKHWTEKLNAILLKPIKKCSELYKQLNKLYSSINDTIAINDFQEVIDSQTIDDINTFLNKINVDTKDYNKFITLLVDLTKLKSQNKLFSFVDNFTKLNPQKIILVFRVEKKTLKENTKFMRNITSKFIETKTKLNLQNKTVYRPPMVIGKIGTYTLKEKDWELYKETIEEKTIGICIADTSICIDVEKLFKLKKPYIVMEELFKKIAKALLKGSSLHRRRSDVLFENINELNNPHQTLFFTMPYNYIRLWNYKAKREDLDEFLTKLQENIDYINTFSTAEETIYRSCGIPIHVDIVMSSVFNSFGQNLSERKYYKTTIRSKQDLLSDELKDYINKRIRLNEIFNSDRFRLHRVEGATPEQVIEEINILFDNYRIPLFSYDFKEKRGNMTLNEFFGK